MAKPLVQMKVDDKELKKIVNAIKALPENVNRNVVNKSIRDASKFLADDIRPKIPTSETGKLKESFRVKKYRTKKTDTRYNIGFAKVVLENGMKKKNTRQYAYYLEWGTKYIKGLQFMNGTLVTKGKDTVRVARASFEKSFKTNKKKWGLS